jgi:hypothetical protein
MDEGAGGQGGRPTGGRSANFRNFRKRPVVHPKSETVK